MDILIASHGFPPTHSAGAERRAERMAKWLTSQDHRVVVLTVERVDDPNQRLETTEQDGFQVHRLYFDIKSGNSFLNLYDNAFIADTLRFVLTLQRFDLVHMISGYLLGAAAIETTKQLGLPLVITLTEYWFMCARLNLIQKSGILCVGPESTQKCTRCLLEEKRRYRIPAQSPPIVRDMFWPMSHHLGFTSTTELAVSTRQFRLKNALDAADMVICPSQFLIDKFQEFDFKTQRFVHIRQGLTTQIAQQKHHDRKQSPDKQLRLAYIGQIKYHKGVDILIEAVIRLLNAGENVRLDLWGKESESPEYVAPLKSRSAQYPAIHWNGHFTGGKIWDILSDMDAVVIPSRWYENSPNTILEAFAMNVPIVTTNLGGMAELVTHDLNGLLFELNQVDDLHHNLSRLVNEPHLLQRLREGIPTVKTIDQEMAEIVDHYEQLLKIYY